MYVMRYSIFMSHPFESMFEKALKKSSAEENLVLKEAEKLKAKGYSADEIFRVLTHLRGALIQDGDIEILTEAVEEFSRYIEGYDED